MNVVLRVKESFCVVGKEGSGLAKDAKQWIQPLWNEANQHFDEIHHLAKTDDDGIGLGFWGAMTGPNRRFERWDGSGLYLAGVEADRNALAPSGWSKWVIPGAIYAVVKVEDNRYQEAFSYMLEDYLPKNHFSVIGAIHEFYAPRENGQMYLYFPIEKI